MIGKTGNYILIGMVLGAIIGVLGGYFLGDVFVHLKFLGTIFLNALKMVVVPLIVASIIVGVSSLGDIRKLGRTTGKTLAYYLATTSFSVLIGIILVNLIRPGVGVPPIGAAIPEFIHGSGGSTIKDVIVGLIPDNIFAAAAGGKILPLIIFSLVFGGVLTAIGRKGKPVIDFFVGLNTAIMKIVILIIYFAPIGILALIGGIVAENRGSLQEIASGLGLYSLTVIIGLLIHAVIILPLILKFFGKKDPFRYFLNMGQALATAFTTASSSATLPVTMESVTDKNKIDSKASSFVLPLGATINMDGTALYEAVAAIFIAQIYGVDLSLGAQVIIFFTATLASIGAAAIPEAGLVMMTLVLSAVGLPLEGIGIILVIDWFLDRCRTTVNVWGDSIGAAVIGETEEIRGYRIGGRETALSTNRKKYTKAANKRSDRAGKSLKTNGKKYGSKSRVPKDSKPSEGKKYQRTKDMRKKSNGKVSTFDKKLTQKKSSPPKTKKPYSRVNNEKPLKKKDTFHLSKKTIEQDLEKVHRQLAEKNKSKESNGKIKDLIREPKPETKSIDKTDPHKGDFFSEGIPKFDFFDDDKTKEARPIEEKSDTIVDSTKSEDIIKDVSTEKNHEEPIVSEIPVISIPSSNDKKPPDEVVKEGKKPAEEKLSEEDLSSSEEKQEDKKDFGWGREKKKRPSK